VVAGLGSTWWQYLLLFLAVAASWAGVPAIGTAALGGAAVAASQDKLDLATVIVVSVLAGEAGGLGGYAIGRRWGRRMLERPGRRQAGREKMMARGEKLYARWGWLAVFFTPAIVSGTAKMPAYRFAFWNLLDSLGWSVAVAGSAYGVGRLATGHHAGRDIAILIIGLAAGVIVAVVAVRRRRRRRTQRLGPLVNGASEDPC
jgi:membrane protein DedA with SNARE-associated domain